MMLANLTADVRRRMLAEVEADIQDRRLLASKRFTAAGVRDYPDLMRRAVAAESIPWLTSELNAGGRIKTQEERNYRGTVKMVDVPHTAAQTFAEGEFNRFYARGLCSFLLETDPDAEVEIYRAKAVENPRSESQRLLGSLVRADKLLNDLRTSIGFDTALGVPNGPNSGLSVKTPAA